MCNLYSMRKQRSEVVRAVGGMYDRSNNQPPMPGVWPDYAAPVVVNGPDGREMRDMRWGMPSSKKALLEAAKKRARKLEARAPSSTSPSC
jgi:putative SOS response-associated peptidase YedK